MIDSKVKIAVKAFAAEALFNLRHRYDWVANELKDQLQFLMQNGSAGIQSKGKNYCGNFKMIPDTAFQLRISKYLRASGSKHIVAPGFNPGMNKS